MSYRQRRPRTTCPFCSRETAVYLYPSDYNDPDHQTRTLGHLAHHACSDDDPARTMKFDITDWHDPIALPSLCADSYAKQLRQSLWDIYAALGFDTDGDPTPESVMGDLGQLVLNAAREYRADAEAETKEASGIAERKEAQ